MKNPRGAICGDFFRFKIENTPGMKKIFALLMTLFVSKTIYAQADTNEIRLGNIRSDTTTFARRSTDFLPSILQSKHLIEIRFITKPSLSYSRSVIVMTYDNAWSVTEYFQKRPSDTATSKMVVADISADSVFSILVLNNIFSLPDQDSIDLKCFVYVKSRGEILGEGMDVNDGTGYEIQFKVADNFRRYTFYNSDLLLDFYSFSNELRNYTAIINAFKRFK